MPKNPTRIEICCSKHDHSTAPDCKYGVRAAEIKLTDAEVAQREADQLAAQARKAEEDAAAEALAALKASAKAKLISGEPLTAEEAATIVL